MDVAVTHDVPTDCVDAHPDAPFSFASSDTAASYKAIGGLPQ